jgi:hypothetical protein
LVQHVRIAFLVLQLQLFVCADEIGHIHGRFNIIVI